MQSRVFQQKSVPDILAEVLKGLRPDLTINLKGNYLPRDYCVQYRESDFDFASRLMEEEGIYYYFQHSAGKHVLVVSDPGPPGARRLLLRSGQGPVPLGQRFDATFTLKAPSFFNRDVTGMSKLEIVLTAVAKKA